MNLKASRAAALLAALSCSTFLSTTPSAQVTTAQNEGQKAARGKADRSTYYRVQASYLYLGERVDFDIQVGCNVYVSVGLDRDRSMMTGLAPMAYGLPMKDGGGLVIVPPKACGGETSENGKIPPNYIPYPITFEDHTKPFEGLGYQSTEAFDSPISKLKFIEAKVTASTKEAFDAWRATEASKNIVKPHMLTFKLGDAFRRNGPYDWRPGGYFPDTCFRANRVEIPEAAKSKVTALWPDSKPKYWNADDGLSVFNDVPRRINHNSNWLTPLTHENWHDTTNIGTMTKTGHDFNLNIISKYYHGGTFYPWRNNFNLNNRNPDTYMEINSSGKIIFSDKYVFIDDNYKGFSFCQPVVPNINNIPAIKYDYKNSKINGIIFEVFDRSGEKTTEMPRNRGGLLAGKTGFIFESDSNYIILLRDEFIDFGGAL